MYIFGIIISIVIVCCIYYKYSRNNRKREGFSSNYKIYIIITTCLLEKDWERREKQYREGIQTMIDYISKNTTSHEVIPIIVENNSKSEHTFLDEFGIPVVYTHSNNIEMVNSNRSYIGKFEIEDIKAVIEKFNIRDEDYIIKFTGRYKLDKDCEFMDTLFKSGDKYDAIVKFGDFMSPSSKKMANSITGLIGMRCEYVKKISYNNQSIEHDWANVAMQIPDERVYIPNTLGLYLWPGMGWGPMSNITDYFLV